MSNKKKNKNKKKTRPAEGVQDVDVVQEEAGVASAVEAEPQKNEGGTVDQLVEDVLYYEEEAKKAKQDAETVQGLLSDLKQKHEELQQQYDALQDAYKAAQDLIANAQNRADQILSAARLDGDQIRSDAEQAAKEQREAAEKERLEILVKAAAEAQEAWKTQIDDLKRQLDEIAAKEKALHKTQLALDRERQILEFDREELEERRLELQRSKERYAAASPAKVETLEIELRDERSKYETLLAKYTDLSKRLEEVQVLLDTIKTEIESAEGTRIVSMREIVLKMQDFKAKYEAIVAIYDKYPDDARIAELEEKARRAERLEHEKYALEQERDRYREEAAAARNANKELEVVRQEVEATRALNEHLLRELESHKTALESRTGDTCPSLSKVDTETESADFVADVSQRMKRMPIDSLVKLVSHIKNYAGSRRMFYTDNDIRAFLAGMAVSRLLILQGMSGTGKSSLPRIFAEAISGFNRLIPVESSWRDRNELLGYYNDFNKKFNAKSFTIELYRSGKKRCVEIPTFIVLDEMNLARIEYYFSDFLAILQEPDQEKWLIELVSSDMRTLPMELPEEVKQKMKKEAPSIFDIWTKIERSRMGDLRSETSDDEKEALTDYLAKLSRLTGAKDLIDGRKIKVTNNIWFVGTANQDESTFEISDKVYDRAQVVSLNHKGVDEGSYLPTPQKFISVTDLIALFSQAIHTNKYREAVEGRLKALDEILMEHFGVSFGNRIVSQTIDFVGVFTAAGGTLEAALDYQISTKILRKVLSDDNGEAFLKLQNIVADYAVTHQLVTKRINELR